MSKADPNRLRSAFGKFATGVTVITTMTEEGEPVGVTANSFTSVSLDPPLVLWSLAKKAYSLPAFSGSGHFAIHVLTQEQAELANRFARSGADKFSAADWTKGVLGSPVFSEYAARFECRTRYQYDGGDHYIFVGEVMSFCEQTRRPLVFCNGKFAETSALEDPKLAPQQPPVSGDLLLRVLARKDFLSSRQVREKLDAANVTQAEYLLLAAVKLAGLSRISALGNYLRELGAAFDEELLTSLQAKKQILVTHQGGDQTVSLTPLAMETILEISKQAVEAPGCPPSAARELG